MEVLEALACRPYSFPAAFAQSFLSLLPKSRKLLSIATAPRTGLVSVAGVYVRTSPGPYVTPGRKLTCGRKGIDHGRHEYPSRRGVARHFETFKPITSSSMHRIHNGKSSYIER